MADPKILAAMAAAAVASEKATGIPAELSFAQCAVESGWLTHAPGNNCFGIKSYPGESGRQLLTTKEWFTPAEVAHFLSLGDSRTAVLDAAVPPQNGRNRYTVQDWFATFPDLAACFAKHAQLFATSRYRVALTSYQTSRDISRFVESISPIYATDPKYAALILSIVRQPNVQAALRVARTPVTTQAV